MRLKHEGATPHARLLSAAKRIRDDLRMRGEREPDGTIVVDCSRGVWASLIETIEESERVQSTVLEALVDAERLFRHYGELHAAKPDEAKAARNYAMADRLAAVIEETSK